MVGRTAADQVDSVLRHAIGLVAKHSSSAKPAATAAAATASATAIQQPQPGQSMVGNAAAGQIDNVLRQVIGVGAERSSAQPATAATSIQPHTLAATDAAAAIQQPQPGQSMVGNAAAGQIDNVLRQVIGIVAEHNSSVPTSPRNASSGVQRRLNEKKDSFRELAPTAEHVYKAAATATSGAKTSISNTKKDSFRELAPTAAKAAHVYKVAATARSRARAASGSDEAVCPTDHLAAAINAPARMGLQAEAAGAEVYIFWLVVLGGGVLVAFFGEQLLKPSLFFVGLFGGFFGAMVLMELMMQQGVNFKDTYCWLPPAISLGVGVIVGLFALWLLSTAIFLLGAIIGLVGSYFLLNLIPIDWAAVGTGPLLLEQRLMPYWLVLLVVPFITGYIAKKKEGPLILAATAVVGGLAVGLASRGLLQTAEVHMPHWGVAMVAGAFALGGGAVQWFVMHPFASLNRKRCGCGKKDGEEPKVDLRRA